MLFKIFSLYHIFTSIHLYSTIFGISTYFGRPAQQAGFGNRQDAKPSPDAEGRRCRVRSRLTPSLPSKAGAMWYSIPVPITRGFETLFTFQVMSYSLKLANTTIVTGNPLLSTAGAGGGGVLRGGGGNCPL